MDSTTLSIVVIEINLDPLDYVEYIPDVEIRVGAAYEIGDDFDRDSF